MISAPDQVPSHELRVIAINGTVFRVDLIGVLKICASRLLLLKLSVFAGVVALFNPPMFGLELPLYATFLYWLILCYVVTGLWILQFWLFDLQRQLSGRDLPVPAPLIVGVSIAGMVWLTYLVAGSLFDLAAYSPWQVWMQALRYFLIAMVIELITVMLVLPRFDHVTFEGAPPELSAVPQAETAAPPEQAARPPEQLKVNNRKISLAQVLWMKSVEHYVEFHCETQMITERAPLRDMVAQAEGSDGIQPHRSWWVSRRAVDRMTRRGGNPVLILTDGTEVPVSRHRKAEVEAWLEGDPAGSA